MGLNQIYKKLPFLIIATISAIHTFANHDNRFESGRAAAMANTSVTLVDVWSVYHNQGGLGYLKKMSVGAFHQSGYIKEQNLQGISFALPTKTGTIAASYSYYGFSQYNEMQAGLAFGRAFSDYFAVGLQLNYLQTHIAGNYGTANGVDFEIGILSRPARNLSIATHIYNPSRSKIGNEEIPVIFQLGASYLFSNKVLLGIETEKSLDYDAIFKIGIDYRLIDYLSLQAGVSTNPSRYSFGLGLHYASINAYIGFFNHQALGYTPSFTLSYGF